MMRSLALALLLAACLAATTAFAATLGVSSTRLTT